jgi:transposase InsO family protein
MDIVTRSMLHELAKNKMRGMLPMVKIPFNRPATAGDELRFVADAVARAKLAGDGPSRQSVPGWQTVMHQLSAGINHYNEVHPHKALGYRSPREFIAAHGSS